MRQGPSQTRDRCSKARLSANFSSCGATAFARKPTTRRNWDKTSATSTSALPVKRRKLRRSLGVKVTAFGAVSTPAYVGTGWTGTGFEGSDLDRVTDAELETLRQPVAVICYEVLFCSASSSISPRSIFSSSRLTIEARRCRMERMGLAGSNVDEGSSVMPPLSLIHI